MSEVQKKIGGNSYCRKCGSYHNCLPDYHCEKGKVSPLQKAQMAFEELEEFLRKAQVKISKRAEVEKLVLSIRETLMIPDKKIYCDEFYLPEEKKKMEELARSLKKSLDSLLNKKKGSKKTETSPKPPEPDYDYNHPTEIIEKAKEIFGDLEKILADNLFVSELSKKEYDAVIEDVKRKVLLIQ